MSEPTWINLRVLKAFHERQINEHGGLPGLRDEGLLLSALSRLENAYHCSDVKPDVAELAAAYGFGLAKIIRSMTRTGTITVLNTAYLSTWHTRIYTFLYTLEI